MIGSSLSLALNKGQRSERAGASLPEEMAKRAHSGRRSMGNTYLTRERRSTAEIDWRRTPEGERREKMALAESGSLDERTVSIQPLDGQGLEEDEVASGTPKNSLQMRVGKAREKKWRDWSGECESRKDSMEAQVEEIWDGEEAERMASARSLDLDWES